MISYYTGVPGSGKSYHLAKEIYKHLQNGKNIISNFNVNIQMVKSKGKKPLGVFIYVNNKEWRNNAYHSANKKKAVDEFSYINGLINYARNFHEYYINKQGELQFYEHQTILVFDECHQIWNAREWARSDRLAWINFFSEHRKFGYDVYFTSQDDKRVDKQIRGLLEDEYLHRKMFNFVKSEEFAKILRRIFGEWFVCIKKKYGMKKSDAKMNVTYIHGEKKFYEFYNSSTIFAFNTSDDFVGVLKAQNLEKENAKTDRDILWNECIEELHKGEYCVGNVTTGGSDLSDTI